MHSQVLRALDDCFGLLQTVLWVVVLVFTVEICHLWLSTFDCQVLAHRIQLAAGGPVIRHGSLRLL